MAFGRTIFLLLFLGCAGALPAWAEVALGLWRTAPDTNGRVMQVRAKPCGEELCVWVERVTDRRGIDKRSGAVGRRMVWDMAQQEDGSYRGKFWDPKVNRVFDTRLSVDGNRILLRPCDAQQCREMTWQRIR
ncbi:MULTISPECIES: DUF2147 domain-containing protein [unclassified Sulfitobacter]|uniref:DUF2147 domain-containing protein n=1 Tax=unclassified Sulfitobacter TaxID=196795 RepID=UPI0009ED8142|nr:MULTISPECIES: DUF2147 domain-containing protein [unclassified Sulfitobacter]